MNMSLFEETAIRSRFQQEWTQWRLQERKYPARVMWWEKHVKRKIRSCCIHEGTERTRDDVKHENVYYECIYDILQERRNPREMTPIHNHLKAKIARIRNRRFQSLPLDTHAATLLQEEQPSIFHLLNMRKWRVSRLITTVIDTDGVTQTTRDILRTFVVFLQRKYDTIQVDNRSVTQLAQAVHRTLATEWRDYLDTPITVEELQAAVRSGACNKAPGRDGICLEFFKVNWES
jgi:hypothetical protein